MANSTYKLVSQETVCTFEFLEQDAQYVVEDAKRVFSESGHTPALWYWTFKGEDYRKKQATLCLFNDELRVSHLTVTAPIVDFDEAIEWVIKNNPHLEINEKHIYYGNAGDDFQHNRVTSEILFKIKQP